MLVAPRVRMFDPAGRFDALEMFAVAGSIAAENDDDAAIIIARPPKPVALMIANRFRQTESRSEEIDRAGLTVTVRENRRPRLFFRRKRFVNSRRFLRHLFPTEFVGKILRERPGRLVFRLRWFK